MRVICSVWTFLGHLLFHLAQSSWFGFRDRALFRGSSLFASLFSGCFTIFSVNFLNREQQCSTRETFNWTGISRCLRDHQGSSFTQKKETGPNSCAVDLFAREKRISTREWRTIYGVTPSVAGGELKTLASSWRLVAEELQLQLTWELLNCVKSFRCNWKSFPLFSPYLSAMESPRYQFRHPPVQCRSGIVMHFFGEKNKRFWHNKNDLCNRSLIPLFISERATFMSGTGNCLFSGTDSGPCFCHSGFIKINSMMFSRWPLSAPEPYRKNRHQTHQRLRSRAFKVPHNFMILF